MNAKSMTAGLVSMAAVAVLAVSAALGGGAEDGLPEPGGLVSNRFHFFATLEGACEDALPEAAAKAILEQDGKGHYRHFVYACPVCSPFVEGLRDYTMRAEFYYSRKGVPLVHDAPPAAVADIAGKLAGKDPALQGAAIHDLVERWVNRRMDRLRLNDIERAQWRRVMAIGRKKGMEGLRSSEGFEHKSCPSCDGANGFEFPKDR